MFVFTMNKSMHGFEYTHHSCIHGQFYAGSLSQPEQDDKFANMIQSMMEPIASLLPPHTDLQAAYESATPEDQAFVQNLALFFGAFLKEHGALLEARVSGAAFVRFIKH